MAASRLPCLLAALLAALLVGCSTVQVKHDYDPGFDFSGYQSWFWLPPSEQGATDPRVHNEITEARVRRALEDTLIARGYSKAPSGEGDFGVGYHLAIEGRIDVRTVDRYYGYGRGWRGWSGGYGYTDTYVDQYDQGMLIVDIVDMRSRQLVWRGTAEARVDESADPERRDARVREAVEKLFAEFPPG
jgi:hypothetical protein